MLEAFLAGFLLGITHAVPPGPITFEVIRRGIVENFIASIKVNAGAVLADGIFFVLIMIGLLQLINSKNGRIAVWIIGCLLLFFLSLRGMYKTISGKGNYKMDNSGEKKSEMSPFITGLLICITSPFAIIWWTSVFAGSIAILGVDVLNLIWAFVGIAIACFAWYAVVGAFASAGKKFLDERVVRVLSFICALIMLFYAFMLAYRGYVNFILS